MLLFSDTEKQPAQSADRVLVIADHAEVMDSVCEQLAIRNTGEVRQFTGTVSQLEKYTESGNVDMVIFEVSEQDDVEVIAGLLELHVSRSAIQIAIGKQDSLTRADSFMQHGISYCHYPSQLNAIGALLASGKQPFRDQNSAIRFSILGCKGGIGTSRLSYHIAENIARIRQSPTLLVQGCGGSRNLDLISRVAISNEVTLLQNNFFAMYEEPNHAWFFNNPLYDRHQCVVFDFSAYNASDENIENILTHSDSVLLICDRDLSSIRIAKKIIEANAHLQNSNNGIKRLYLCFNQHHPKINGEVIAREMGDLVGQQADIIIPYMLKAGDPSLSLEVNGKFRPILESMTYLLLGKKKEITQPSLLSVLKQRLTRKSD